jgi:integrase
MTKELTTQDRQPPIVARLLASKRSALTRAAYEDDLLHFQQFLGYPLGDIPNTPEAWQEITPTHVAAYLETMQHEVSEHTGRTYSTATIARRLTAVRELLNEAVWAGLYPKEQLDYIKERIKPPEVTSEHHGALTPDDQAAILNTAADKPGLKGLRDYALFRLWLETGMRRAELAALQVRDLTTKEGVPQVIVRQGKGNRTRSIPLDNYTDYVVKDWLKRSGQDGDPHRPIFCQLRKTGRGSEARYVVVDPDKALSGTALYKLVKRYARQTGITSKITPHSFRATVITDARAAGASNREIMETTGHKDARMLDEVYDRNVYNEPLARRRKHKLPKRPGELL